MIRILALMFLLISVIVGCGGGGGKAPTQVSISALNTASGANGLDTVVGVNDSGQCVGYSQEYVAQTQSNVFKVKVWTPDRIVRTVAACPDSGLHDDPIGIDRQCRVATSSTMGAIIWSGGSPRALPLPSGCGRAMAFGMNDAGDIVGAAATWGQEVVGLLWRSDGSIVRLETLDWSDCRAVAVNVRRDAVGSGRDATGWVHAVLWRNGHVQDLGVLPQHVSSAAFDINMQGAVVGASRSASGIERAFVWQNGKMMDLGTLGGEYSHAWAVNDSEAVVGGSLTDSGQYHAFVWRDGRMVDLNSLLEPSSGWELLDARDISNSGWIVGTGVYKGQQIPFIMHM